MSAMAPLRLKSPASRLFTQLFKQSADQRKHQSSTSLAFVRATYRWSVNSPHKGPVTRKMFPFDDVIMKTKYYSSVATSHDKCIWLLKTWYFYVSKISWVEGLRLFTCLLFLIKISCPASLSIYPKQFPASLNRIVKSCGNFQLWAAISFERPNRYHNGDQIPRCVSVLRQALSDSC